MAGRDIVANLLLTKTVIVDRKGQQNAPAVWQRGFSLLEFAVVVVIVSVLLWVIAVRFLGIQAFAEEAAVEQVVGALRSGLGIKVAELQVKGDIKGLVSLEGSNPMERLSQVPKNYLGALRQPNPGQIEGGHWYFDVRARTLVYQVRNQERIEGGLRNPARIRWAVRLRYYDRNRVSDRGVERVADVQLVPLETYHWKR